MCFILLVQQPARFATDPRGLCISSQNNIFFFGIIAPNMCEM